MSNFEFISHRTEVESAFRQQLEKGLEMCGGTAETYAKELCPVDTGALRNSISHKVVMDENACYVGTNMEYAPYIEMGTGIYYKDGRRSPWAYMDRKGEFHITRGSKAQPFLKPAVSNNAKELREIIKDALKG